MDTIEACATIARVVETEYGAASECARLLQGDVSWTIGSVRDLLTWAAANPDAARAVSDALGATST